MYTFIQSNKTILDKTKLQAMYTFILDITTVLDSLC